MTAFPSSGLLSSTGGAATGSTLDLARTGSVLLSACLLTSGVGVTVVVEDEDEGEVTAVDEVETVGLTNEDGVLVDELREISC